MGRRFTTQYRALSEADPVLAGLYQTYGPQDPFEWSDGGRTGDSLFAAMVLHIIGQQISASATFAVYDRVAKVAGGIPSAERILKLGAPPLRECGLSWAKVTSVLDLAQRQSSGVIDLEHLTATPDDEVISGLTAVKGIGLWSAQTFLIRQLKRPDVLPEGDVGIRRAITQAWSLPVPPSAKQVHARGVTWAPYRTFAAGLLWRSLAPIGEEFDPKAKALARAQRRSSDAGPVKNDATATRARRAPSGPAKQA